MQKKKIRKEMKVLGHEARLRGPQKRAEETRERLIEAGARAFSTIGFEAATVAVLEKAAQVQRGLLAYHFGSRAALRLAVIEALEERLQRALRRYFADNAAGGDPLRAVVAAVIRANAEVPELTKILAQMRHMDEAYVGVAVSKHIRQLLGVLEPIAGHPVSVHDYYIFAGATIYPAVWGGEARHVWGLDTHSEEFLERQTEIVVGFLRKYWRVE